MGVTEAPRRCGCSRLNRDVKRHDAPATWDSKVRGLTLGLAFGDAFDSERSNVPSSCSLEGRAAIQLAAWTTEGLVRIGERSKQPSRTPTCTAAVQALPKWVAPARLAASSSQSTGSATWCRRVRRPMARRAIRGSSPTKHEDLREPREAASMIELVEAHIARRGYRPMGERPDISGLLEGARGEIAETAARYLALMKQAFNTPVQE